MSREERRGVVPPLLAPENARVVGACIVTGIALAQFAAVLIRGEGMAETLLQGHGPAENVVAVDRKAPLDKPPRLLVATEMFECVGFARGEVCSLNGIRVGMPIEPAPGRALLRRPGMMVVEIACICRIALVVVLGGDGFETVGNRRVLLAGLPRIRQRPDAGLGGRVRFPTQLAQVL